MSSSRQADALDKVHPDLVDLLIRLDLLHIDDGNGISEANLARTIFLAIELADPEEQALLVSRMLTQEEAAAERLRSPEVQNTSHRVVLDNEERKAALLEDPSEPEPRTNGEDCMICYESAHVRAPCGCNYCQSCYREPLRIGLRSQAEFPPRCCQPLDEAAVALARSPALVHLFRQIQEEEQTPIPDRIYCHDGNCAAFIPPDRKGHCLVCLDTTCLECGAKAHRGEPCAEGDAEEDVWATMDANRSINCPDCGRMIQLSEACNHLTCPCGCDFCYLCGVGWKRCRCPQYGSYETMVPMRHRPGVKPPRFRRRPHRTEAPTSQDGGIETLRIPQLRPNPGEEGRQPGDDLLASGRVIRPLVLPQNEEDRREDLRGPEIRQGRERERGPEGRAPRFFGPGPVRQLIGGLPPYDPPVDGYHFPALQRHDAPRPPIHRRALDVRRIVGNAFRPAVNEPRPVRRMALDNARNPILAMQGVRGDNGLLVSVNPVPPMRRRGREEQHQGGGGVDDMDNYREMAERMAGRTRNEAAAFHEEMEDFRRNVQAGNDSLHRLQVDVQESLQRDMPAERGNVFRGSLEEVREAIAIFHRNEEVGQRTRRNHHYHHHQHQQQHHHHHRHHHHHERQHELHRHHHRHA